MSVENNINTDITEGDSYLDDMSESDFMNEMESFASGGTGSFQENAVEENDQEEEITPDKNEDHIDNLEVDNSANTNDENDKISIDETIESVNKQINDDNEISESVDNVELLSQEEIEEFHAMKSQFAKLDQEFTVDGRKVQGLTDPEHILDLQKAYYQLKDNKSDLNEVAPVYDALKESGLLSDHSKLTMLLEAANGSPEAIKMLLKQNDIDPMELDTENIDEESVLDSQSKYVASENELNLKDFYTKATNLGKQDVAMEQVIKSWDSDSLISLVQDPESTETVLGHIEDGSFDRIMDEVANIKRTDFNDVFSKKNSYEQYVEANGVLYDRIIRENEVAKERHDAMLLQQSVNNKVITPPIVTKNDDSDRIEQAMTASSQSEKIGSNVAGSNSVTSIDDMSYDEVVNFFESFITN